MSDERIIGAVTQYYKLVKPTPEVRTELASSMRAINQLLRTAAEAEKHLKYASYEADSLETRVNLGELVKYSMSVSPFPMDDSIYQHSWLANQTRAQNRKTADPKVEVVNRDLNNEPSNPEHVRSFGQIILNIELEEGAWLLYTTDGSFPVNHKVGTVKYLNPFQRTTQLTFDQKCTLRMVAQRFEKLDSNCISLELLPQFSDEPRRDNYIMKHQLRMDESATVQSDPFFK